jgi:hypothetical protein
LRGVSGQRLTFRQIRRGDRIVTTGTPDPQQALAYAVGGLTDKTTGARGVIPGR